MDQPWITMPWLEPGPPAWKACALSHWALFPTLYFISSPTCPSLFRYGHQGLHICLTVVLIYLVSVVPEVFIPSVIACTNVLLQVTHLIESPKLWLWCSREVTLPGKVLAHLSSYDTARNAFSAKDHRELPMGQLDSTKHLLQDTELFHQNRELVFSIGSFKTVINWVMILHLS